MAYVSHPSRDPCIHVGWLRLGSHSGVFQTHHLKVVRREVDEHAVFLHEARLPIEAAECEFLSAAVYGIRYAVAGIPDMLIDPPVFIVLAAE